MEKTKLLAIFIYITIIFIIDSLLLTTVRILAVDIHGYIGFNILAVLAHLIGADIIIGIKVYKERQNNTLKKQDKEKKNIVYCQSCGAEILDKMGEFCSKCGAPNK